MNTLPPSPVVDVQLATTGENIPSEEEFKHWVRAALPSEKHLGEVTIRVVDVNESRTLNAQYRGKDAPTNVLSFPSDLPSDLTAQLDRPYLGDLIICAPVVDAQAQAQKKTSKAHWAHLVVHGTLHLIGYDHIEDLEAEAMEALETKIIVGLAFPPPYQ